MSFWPRELYSSLFSVASRGLSGRSRSPTFPWRGFVRAHSARQAPSWRTLEMVDSRLKPPLFTMNQSGSGWGSRRLLQTTQIVKMWLPNRGASFSGRSPLWSIDVNRGVLRRGVTSLSQGVAATSELLTERPLHGALMIRFRSIIQDYLRLSKYRLTGMVVLSAQAGYMLRPKERLVEGESPSESSASAGPELSGFPSWQNSLREQWQRAERFLWLSVGTFLCAAAANAMNQIMESRLDARMRRTCARPIPAGRLSAGHALVFACLSGISGVIALYWGTNPTTALLGLGNTLLYVSVYTPLKVLTPANTWIGALVGALPPLMGWFASSPSPRIAQDEQMRRGSALKCLWSGLPLAVMLFLWQIPHFHALALLCRADYARAGYRMLAQTNPLWNARLAWLSSVALIPTGLWFVSEGLCSPWFGLENALLALWMTLKAGQFVRRPLEVCVARQLFRQSIIYLPLTLALMLLHREPESDAMPSVHTPTMIDPCLNRSPDEAVAEGIPELSIVAQRLASPSAQSQMQHVEQHWSRCHGRQGNPSFCSRDGFMYEFIPPLPYLPPPRV
jgi:protoheme IX farnesyltransferase